MPAPSHDHGLSHDLEVIQRGIQRRQALRWLASLGAAGTLPLVGCGGGGDAGTSVYSTTTATTSTTSTTSASGTSTCSVVPEETAGPYPGDGSNSSSSGTANALALSGIVRSNITTSIAGASGTAAGVPLTVVITLTNTNASCAQLVGYVVYLWHCDRDGKYSMYASGLTQENYLRGAQETDGNGMVTFQTIFPGCYDGRMPHMHFEIYPSLARATSYANKIKTSQLAFPVATCQDVYSQGSGYSASVSNLAKTSFAQDNVFSDGVTQELVSITGDVTSGYTASITVSVAA
jgi:protocatechuate 3,4-dioxygenase beta subunit